MIHAFATRPNYWRHLRPIVRELARRNVPVQTWGSEAWHPWGEPIKQEAQRFSFRDTVVVASHQDAQEFKRCESPLVYVEHGAGQTYIGYENGEGFPGARALTHVDLFLCPNDHVADRWRGLYELPEVVVVGEPVLTDLARARDISRGDWVATACHWDCPINAETKPALEEYRFVMPTVASMVGGKLMGHAHPRIAQRVEQWWKDEVRTPFCHDPDEVLANCRLLIADNTSLMYEAAALDIPVVAINGAGYRKDVFHGLRFWDYVPGLQCDRPEDLPTVLTRALGDPREAKALRARAAARAYAATADSAPRAADAIIHAERRTPRVTENRSQFDDMLIRLHAVGATPEEIEAFREQWPEMTDDERNTLRHLNDVRLAQEVRLARDEGEWQTTTEEEQAQLDAQREAERQSYDDDNEALQLLAYDPQYIVSEVQRAENVGVLASRLLRLETAAPDPRPSLVDALKQLAG